MAAIADIAAIAFDYERDPLAVAVAPGTRPAPDGGAVRAGVCAAGAGRVGLVELTDPAELIVSELVTNAITASRGLVGSRFGGRWSAETPPIRVWPLSDQRTVLVQVWDGNNRMPARQELDAESEGGRGLWLVEAVSEDWGAFHPPHASGKVVWASVAKP